MNEKNNTVERFSQHDRWISGLRATEDFITRHGRIPSRNSEDQAEAALGRWVTRGLYTHKQGKLPAERQRELAASHALLVERFNGARADSRWEVSCGRLLKFVESNERLPEVDADTDEERFVYRWLYDQSGYMSRGIILPEREQHLRNLHPLVTELLLRDTWNDRWDENFGLLALFVEQQQRLPVASSLDGEEAFIARWLRSQQSALRRGRLHGKRTDRLKKLDPMVSQYLGKKSGKDAWVSVLQSINDFVRRHQRMPSPQGEQDEHLLARWVQRQSSPSIAREFCQTKLSALEDSHELVRERLTRGL